LQLNHHSLNFIPHGWIDGFYTFASPEQHKTGDAIQTKSLIDCHQAPKTQNVGHQES
jgi:hypothetical protein